MANPMIRKRAVRLRQKSTEVGKLAKVIHDGDGMLPERLRGM
jgi:hypothetical protein